MGYYGSRSDDLITENEPLGNDFLAEVGRDWEKAAQSAQERGHRVILMRFGVVFGQNGGAFQQMATLFKRFAGGPIGDGKQWFPWIHIDDIAQAIDYLIDESSLNGPFNFCAPHPLRNREVAQAFGSALKRPAILPTPAFVLRLALGEFSQTLLASQRVVPQRLLEHGYGFRFPHLNMALADLVD